MLSTLIKSIPLAGTKGATVFWFAIENQIHSIKERQSLSLPNIIPLNLNSRDMDPEDRRQKPSVGSFRLISERSRGNSAGWSKTVLLAFFWLAVAHVLVADLMWTSFPMYALYTLPPLIAALFLRRNYVLPLALAAFLLAAGSIATHHEYTAPAETWVRFVSAAGVALLGVALAKRQPVRRQQAAATTAEEHHGIVPAEHGTTAQPESSAHRPLILERRKKRDLPRDAKAQMQELELLTRRLIQIQEQQQQTVSRELHDNIAQVLTAVTNRLALARTTSARIPAWLQHELFDLQEHIGNALDDIRTLARDMRPALLDHCGFAAALEKQTQGVRTRTGMDFRLEIDAGAVVPFDSENLTHLFRLAQEALQNIEEHSRASQAWLQLGRKNGELHLEIGDNGSAFSAARVTEAQADGHLGLLGMRERAELLGGSFLLESEPGTGTVIRVAVPVPPPAKTALNPVYENNLSPHC